MLYTPLTKKALRISFAAHKDQLDKSNIPYVYHPYELATQMDTEAETCVALLHDVVEDTSITLDQLRDEGFTDEILDAIRLMTHDDDTPYFDYVRRLRDNPIAARVKMADLRHNSDTSRLEVVTPFDLSREDKYRTAMAILKGEAE